MIFKGLNFILNTTFIIQQNSYDELKNGM